MQRINRAVAEVEVEVGVEAEVEAEDFSD